MLRKYGVADELDENIGIEFLYNVNNSSKRSFSDETNPLVNNSS